MPYGAQNFLYPVWHSINCKIERVEFRAVQYKKMEQNYEQSDILFEEIIVFVSSFVTTHGQ
jgi:hypothetical protein